MHASMPGHLSRIIERTWATPPLPFAAASSASWLS
jgi:hypothetical protein